MAKLSKNQMIVNLIELYSSDTEVRDHMIPQIKAELERYNDLLDIGPVDWDFMRLPDKLLADHPQVYFERLMGHYYNYHSDAWIRKHYRDNFKKVAA